MRKKKGLFTDQVDSKAKPHALESGESKLENWADQPDSEVYDEAIKLYTPIQRAYDNKQEQSDNIEEYWNIFNAIPDENQQYSGNSQCYVPAVRDCINARTKRKLKQLFPVNHKHVDAVGTDGETPYPQLALLEHYIRSTRLKDIVRSDLIAGDVTGQWNLYIDWTSSYRRITEIVKRNAPLANAAGETMGLLDPTEEQDQAEERDIKEEGPDIVDFATEDLAVVPPTCNDLERAEAVSLRLRMSRDKVKQMVDEGVFVQPQGQDFDTFWEKMEAASKTTQPDGQMQKKAPPKARANDAGIKTEGTYKYLLVYEATARLEVDGAKRLVYIYYAGPQQILGIIKAPQWGGKRPVLSAPIERIGGSFFGKSKIEPVKFLQWNLNDYWNMGQDSAMYSLLPIVMTDPLSNPNYASMVIGLAAVWAADPNKTKFASMPALYKEAIPLCETIKRQIWESMDVNEMMMGRTPQGRKNNQMIGQMQQEQMTNIEDEARRYEEAMLNPLVERMFEYDTQFRTKALTVLTMGEVGVKAKMTDVEPQQFGHRYFFQWAGTSFMMGIQQLQQKIAWMNVLRGVPPQLLNGRKLDVTPIIEAGTEQIFGPELTPRILIDERNLFTIDANTENEILHNGMPVDVHDADNDVEHIQSHQSAARLTGDLKGRFRSHIAAHIMALKVKQQKQMGMQGQPGVPGGAEPGVAGTPRMGAQPGAPKGAAQPPGGVHPDTMLGGPGRG